MWRIMLIKEKKKQFVKFFRSQTDKLSYILKNIPFIPHRTKSNIYFIRNAPAPASFLARSVVSGVQFRGFRMSSASVCSAV